MTLEKRQYWKDCSQVESSIWKKGNYYVLIEQIVGITTSRLPELDMLCQLLPLGGWMTWSETQVTLHVHAQAHADVHVQLSTLPLLGGAIKPIMAVGSSLPNSNYVSYGIPYAAMYIIMPLLYVTSTQWRQTSNSASRELDEEFPRLMQVWQTKTLTLNIIIGLVNDAIEKVNWLMDGLIGYMNASRYLHLMRCRLLPSRWPDRVDVNG